MNQPRQIAGQPAYQCFCEQGWTKSPNSPACTVDVDECGSRRYPCSSSPRVTCINLPGTFHCGPCPNGFTGDGFTCADIDECSSDNGGCSRSPLVSCSNTIGSRICGPCPAGFVGDGVTCTFVGACRIGVNGGCHRLATCLDNVAISGSYRECRCPTGYAGSGVGSNGCVQTSGLTCSANPCVHGSCLPSTSGQEPLFTCQCNSGYIGTLCDQLASACALQPCQNGGTCTDTPGGGYTCHCDQSWTGTTCSQAIEECGGRFSDPIGSIRFPMNGGEYPHGRSCAWQITTTPGHVLNITFSAFHLEHSGDSCPFDFVQINDGPDASSNTLGRWCGQDPPPPIVTNHDAAYIWFHSDQTVAGMGFELAWNTSVATCGGLISGSDYGAVNSPGYPGQYPHNRDCYWLIEVTPGRRIQLHFATLAIESHANCSYDYLRVYDGSAELDPVLK